MSSKKVKKVIYLKRWYKTIKTVKPVSVNMSSPELLKFLRKAGLEHLYQVFTGKYLYHILMLSFPSRLEGSQLQYGART